MKKYTSLNDKLNRYLEDFNDKKRIDTWVDRKDAIEKKLDIRNMLGAKIQDHFLDSQKTMQRAKLLALRKAKTVREMEAG